MTDSIPYNTTTIYFLGGTEVGARTWPLFSIAWSFTSTPATGLHDVVLSHRDNFYRETYHKHNIIFQLTNAAQHTLIVLVVHYNFLHISIWNPVRFTESLIIYSHVATH
jgi:hypothetical protein